MSTSMFSFINCLMYKCGTWFYAFRICYIWYAKQIFHIWYSMIECRTKCPALIHDCRTYNIFYQSVMSDGYTFWRCILFKFLFSWQGLKYPCHGDKSLNNIHRNHTACRRFKSKAIIISALSRTNRKYNHLGEKACLKDRHIHWKYASGK